MLGSMSCDEFEVKQPVVKSLECNKCDYLISANPTINGSQGSLNEDRKLWVVGITQTLEGPMHIVIVRTLTSDP